MEVKAGQIVLIRSYNTSARIIQFGMFLRYLLRFRKPQKVYNHAGIGISNNRISEALAKGVANRDFEVYKHKKCEILVYEFPLTKIQLFNLEDIVQRYTKVKYQLVNFIQFIPEIFTGIWLGRTKLNSDDQLYCTEYVALLVNMLTNGKHFQKHWRTSPNHIREFCDKHCKKVAEYIIT